MPRARALLLVLAGTLSGWAAPAWSNSAGTDRPTVLPGNMPQLSQGRGSGGAFTPAPVPNPDAIAPRSQRDPNAIQLVPGLARPGIGGPAASGTGSGSAGRGGRDGNDALARGGTYSRELERVGGRPGSLGSALVPSLNLRMPMQIELGQSRP